MSRLRGRGNSVRAGAPRQHRLRLAALKLWVAVSLALGLAAFFAIDTTAAEPKMRASDWKAIKQVIVDQRAALVAGDRDKAFSYATPALHTQFGDATTFMAMVHLGYPTLLTARYTEFLDGAVIDGLVVQPLRLIDADNSVRLALYTLERQQNGSWRISGCRIGSSTVQAA
jgi:hypothetical protein